ncbi:MAG: hypothetical protein ACLS8R_04180 [Anaeromassilibacillus sp.]
MGRMIFNRPIPQDLGFVDRSDPENRFKFEIEFLVGKKQLERLLINASRYTAFRRPRKCWTR